MKRDGQKNGWINGLVTLVALLVMMGLGEGISRLWLHPPIELISELNPTPEQKKGENLTAQGLPDVLYQYSEQGRMRLRPNAHILIKNHELSHRDILITTNSLGFRAPELSVPKPKDEFRILVLGDSITLGDYVPNEDTYPSRMDHYLRLLDPSVQVINAGIGSADIQNEYQILLDSGLKTEPDIVFIGLYLNDGELSANLIVGPLPGFLKRSYLLNYLYRKAKIVAYRWRHRQELAGEGRPWLTEFARGRHLREGDWKRDLDSFDYLIVKNVRDWGAAWDPKTWQVIRDKIVRIQELGRIHHFKLFVALFPVRYQVEADSPYDQPQQSFEYLMEDLKIAHLDLLPVLREHWQGGLQFPLYYDKCHLTPQGNDLVGQSIAKGLSARSP